MASVPLWSEGNGTFQVECYSLRMMNMDDWPDKKPYLYSFPLFIIQVLLILSTTRATHFLLGRLGLPQYISEIIGGTLLGPSVLGRNAKFVQTLFHERSRNILDISAYIGLIFFLFTVGVQIDLSSLRRASMRRFSFGLAFTIPTLIIGTAMGLPLHGMLNEGTSPLSYTSFVAVLLSVTAFSMLEHNVAKLKLAGTEMAKLALSVAILIDGIAWGSLSVVIGLSVSSGAIFASSCVILTSLAFYAATLILVPPLMRVLSKEMSEGNEEMAERIEVSVLFGVLIAALIGDVIGANAYFGAFVYGMSIPHGPLGRSSVERVDEFVRGLLMPLFFAICGMKIDMSLLIDVKVVFAYLALVVVSGGLKVLGGVIVAVAYNMEVSDGVSLGLLMNSKGVIELMLLDLGVSKKIIGDKTFSIMAIMSIVQTALVNPFLTSLIKPAHHIAFCERRTVFWHDPGSVLRIMACVYHPLDVPSLMSLVDFTCPTKKYPVSVSVLQLIELTSRASTILLKNVPTPQNMYSCPLQGQFAAISQAFENYEENAEGVSTETSTALSPFETMDEDVLVAADDCHAALVVLPFHMHQAVDGVLEMTLHPSVRFVNQRILDTAPCTVAIIIDRGIGNLFRIDSMLRVAVLFFGGPDDRESIALASRMVRNPSVELSIIHFLPKNTNIKNGKIDETELRERSVDEKCLHEIKVTSNFVRPIIYQQYIVSNAEETFDAIKMIKEEKRELLIVGKGQGVIGPRLTAEMMEWCEFHELGPIGDLLASVDFGATSSVLVVQARSSSVAEQGTTETAPETKEEANISAHSRQPVES